MQRRATVLLVVGDDHPFCGMDNGPALGALGSTFALIPAITFSIFFPMFSLSSFKFRPSR